MNKEYTVAVEVCKSGTLTAVTSDINRDFDAADHLTFGNDDVTCVAGSSIWATVDVAVEGKTVCVGVGDEIVEETL